MKLGKHIFSTILWLAANLSSVDAHGHMTSPRSRNWVAWEDGVDSWGNGAGAGIPPK